MTSDTRRSSRLHSTAHQLHSSDAPAPPQDRPRSIVLRVLLPAAAILLGLLAVTHLSSCASTPLAVPVETGEIGPGGRLGSKGTSDSGLAWSLLVGESDIDIHVGDTSIVLRGYGTQHRVLYTRRDTDLPELTFTISGRPRVWWHGYTLKVGAAVHDLSEPDTYVVMPDGELRSE